MRGVIGIISDIRQSQFDGYTILILKQNFPFRTIYRTFQVSNYEIENLKSGDEIKGLTFSNMEQGFYQLSNIEQILIDICPESRCYSFLEAENAQRTECPDCWNIPDDEARIRMELCLHFQASFSFKNSVQLHLYKDCTLYYSLQIYDNHPLFQKANNLNLNTEYRVTAWKVYTTWESHGCWDTEPEELEFWVKVIGLDIIDIVDIE